ncbi:hypothetical protein C8034_v009846 [Colletotrichum sidae]|uniref:non-specific serine/threonine protein kinase n=1 Tax=Colletotrichum sidae TaxID=1347389 RepID=A0A4R8T3A0_9PEZI|nr:hypothetical protein C8034_v009846 [Colletotrichum sidae]
MNSPFPYNNFIYRVNLSSPPTTAQFVRNARAETPQPGTVPCPAGTTSLILRLANPDPRIGIKNTNRVENEIASMVLVRQALSASKYSRIVPDVYTWASMSDGQGFSMQQAMPGPCLRERVLTTSPYRARQSFLGKWQISWLCYKALSAQMTLFAGAPSPTYTGFRRNIFNVKLREADDNPVMQGWREGGVRSRLDAFIDGGLAKALADLEQTKTLVHADFTTNNLLFDPSTLQVTALLDFDFSYVGTAADEFMGFSFGNICGGTLPGPYESAADQLALRQLMLSGFRETPPAGWESSETQRDLAEEWDRQLARAGAARPSTISLFEEIANIYWLQDKVSPFQLHNPMMRKRMTEEQQRKARKTTEDLMIKFLVM